MWAVITLTTTQAWVGLIATVCGILAFLGKSVVGRFMIRQLITDPINDSLDKKLYPLVQATVAAQGAAEAAKRASAAAQDAAAETHRGIANLDVRIARLEADSMPDNGGSTRDLLERIAASVGADPKPSN